MFDSVRDTLRRLWAPISGGRRSDAIERLARPRLEIQNEPDRIYAIGDIHGCFDKLRGLEAAIFEDARTFEGSKMIVYLGDYIDRGVSSSAVIDHLVAPPPEGFYRICLAGNHEEVLVDVIEGRRSVRDWLQLGGDSTLLSYGYDLHYMARNRRISNDDGIAAIIACIPPAHLNFLRRIPATFATPNFIFVHAGLRPGVPLETQKERDLLWIRDTFLDAPEEDFGRTVVYGHTQSLRPALSEQRIGIDTGAYMGGPLTAARLTRGEVDFISYR